jgi:hypothetical protein
MNNDNFFFKELDIPNYEAVLSEIQKFYMANNPQEDRSQFSHISAGLLELNSPNLAQWLKDYNLQLRVAAIIRTPSGNVNIVPHVDTQTKDLAINFPVVNCADCWTGFYQLTGGEKINRVLPNRLTYVNFSDDATFEEVSRFVLTKPTIFNTKQPHAVVNPTNSIRIAASLRFVRDPWELTE